ncbi:NHL repeat domain protein [Methanosarcina horonobensis HB-1 = JCM 15518]|uniref:NHL repeat domain protein n=2 Tax=Methanosarcina horonobensis TaxID=418008 RepID=A0A0E3SE24_9EURY|nr:phage tail protein [Methanosarcina horonobensis]AKB78407.1 NHL repeat domain protein [Methanosarcina horonobensis HB-1 = JCM 15518]
MEYSENLDLRHGDLRLSSAYTYLFEEVLLGNPGFIIEDIAVDECGFLYLLSTESIADTDNPINTESPADTGSPASTGKSLIFRYAGNTAALKPIGNCPGIFPLKLGRVSAIGVDEDTLYIADNVDGSNSRLSAFTKSDYHLRWTLSKGPVREEAEGEVEGEAEGEAGEDLKKITGIKCDEKGNIYILEGNRVLSINKHSPSRPEPRISCKINGSGEPKILEVDKEGKRYVLEGNRIHIFKAGETEAERKIDIENFSPSGIAVDAWKEVFVGEADETGDENQTEKTIHKLEFDNNLLSHPLWSYRDTCKKLVYGPEGRLYVLDGKGKKLTSLIRKKVDLKAPDNSFRGTYISKPVDSQERGTIWHRLVLDGDFAKGTQIEFFYFSSDEKLSGDQIEALGPDEWKVCISETSAVQGYEKRDSLFLDRAEGRYLWFKIILSGTEEISPCIASIGIFFPRASYIDYLPAIYREEPHSRDLLERFLSIFESIIFEMDHTIEHIDRVFDADFAPPEFLSWLASWLAVPVDEDWSEEKKRLFIRHAASLYIKRGTREGLSESIELFTGIKPLIVENFRIEFPLEGNRSLPCTGEDVIFFPPDEARVKIDGREENLVNVLFGTEKFVFTVFLKSPGIDTDTIKRVRRIIDEQKPAHTCYNLKVLEPWFYLDMHTYLGINTALTEPEFILGTKAVIGRDTILGDEEKAGQVERHSRAGIDTVLS